MDRMKGMVIKMKGISSAVLKWVALITMAIDHIGAAVVGPLYSNGYFENTQFWYAFYYLLRGIGRIAFPIYCFLLVEGILHTRNRKRYLLQLFVFAMLSEYPFDLAFDMPYAQPANNVFFTLLFGGITVSLYCFLRERTLQRVKEELRKPLHCLLVLTVTGLMGGIAYACHTDYSYKGIILIMILYLFRENRRLQGILGYLSFCWEATCFPAFILIQWYNGKRGRQNKYFFYLFYPLHLLALSLIRIWIM